MRQLSITIMEELDTALHLAAIERGVSKSRIIETFLREHSEVKRRIDTVRAEPDVAVFAVGPSLRKRLVTRAASTSGKASPRRRRR